MVDIKQVSLQPLDAPPAPTPEPATLVLLGADCLASTLPVGDAKHLDPGRTPYGSRHHDTP